jgi:hypothetical protein
MAEEKVRILIPILEVEKAALHQHIVGQDEAIEAFANLEAQLRSGIRSTKPAPLDIKFLSGPSGVGKTELVLAFADLLSGDREGRGKVIIINGAEYQQEHTIARLFGSPPGYVGSRGSGSYIEPVLSRNNLDKHKIIFKDRAGKTKSATIILIDEAEKAHLALHYALLSVLDKGRLDMADNTSVDYSDVVILYTSNIGNQEVERYKRRDPKSKKLDPDNIIMAAFKDVYPPEYQGRINEVIIFRELTTEQIRIITEMKVEDIKEVFKANGIAVELELSDAALQWLIDRGFKPAEGVRSMAKIVNRHILDKLRIAASQGIDLNRKIIYVDVGQEGAEPDELAFYYGVGDFPDAIPGGEVSDLSADDTEAIDEEILSRLLEELKSAAQLSADGPDDFFNALHRSRFSQDVVTLVDAGVISFQDVALRYPKVVDQARKLVRDSVKGGLTAFLTMVDRMSILRILREADIKQLKGDEKVITFFGKELQKRLEEGLKSYIKARDQLTLSDIGDKAFWDLMFNEERMNLARKG